jgi:small subunit ribosomal protein S13
MNEQKINNYSDKIIRILGKDIPGNLAIYPGLIRIKGISWAISNAICKSVEIDKRKKIGALTKEEIQKIELFMKKPEIKTFLKNRKKDFETNDDKHLIGTDLELRKDFDIKRLKKIKSYRGLRHASGLPVRGQRTRSNFRKNRSKGAGIKKKNKKPEKKDYLKNKK